MSSLKVLVVDDDPDVRAFVLHLLEVEGHDGRGAGDVEEASRVLSERPVGAFDVVLLDVYLPGRPGWELVETLRREGDSTPVIFLTAAQHPEDRVRGLKLGADDYLCKPFLGSELLARVDAVVRRQRALPVLVHGDLRLDLARRTADRGGQRIELGRIEFALLQALMEARGAPVSRIELLKRVWGLEFDPETGVLDVTVARLRRKLDRGREPMLQTVPGLGYCLGFQENYV